MIVVTGSIAFDQIMNFPGRFADQIMPDKIHALNLAFLTDQMRKNFGGSAANTAYSLNLLGQKATVLATAGQDFSDYKKFLTKSGIITKYIKIYKSDLTANYFAVVDQSDNQFGAFYPGATQKSLNLNLKTIKEKVTFVIIGPSMPEATVKLAQQSFKLNLPYLFDLSFQVDELNKPQLLATLKHPEIIIGNDYEVALLIKKTELNKKQILKRAKVLVTTLAEKGSIIETQDKKINIKPARVKNTSDPVGAGDAYRAGFTAGYIQGLDLKTCGQMGSVAAAYTVEKYGTTTHRFTQKAFCQRYKLNYNKALNL